MRRLNRRWWGRAIKRAIVLFFGLVVFSIIAFCAAVKFWPYPIDELRPPESSTWITDREGNTLAAFVGSDGNWCQPIPEERMSQHLLDAIVAVEDQRFYQHGGVDWQSAASAAWQDLVALRYRRGASTLTMQLEHLRKPAARSLVTKLVQAIRADQIERQLTKQQIVAEYLNRAPFGGNVCGVEAASWRYFGRHAADLSLGQAALLAGIPQSPARLRPDRFPAAALARRNHVLERMLACGMITENQRREAAGEPIDLDLKELPQDLPEEIGLLPTLVRLAHESSGQVIHTTIDLNIQRQATVAVEDQLKELSASHVTAAAVVVLDTSSGEVLAAISRVQNCTPVSEVLRRPGSDAKESGASDYLRHRLGQNGADAVDLDLTVRPRSSGSTLKPFIYAAAFDAGICTPQTILDDSPAAWAEYQPENYDRQFLGPMTAGDALAQSRNVPALVVLSKLHVDRAVEVMRGCGLATLARTPDRYGLPLAIGGAEVTAMELAEGYATLGRGGVHLGSRLLPAEAGSPVVEHGVLRSSSCLMALQCIADLDRTRRIYSPAVDLSPAWKTGTSSGHRDAWCAAVTPRRVVVVWLGNADGSGSDALVGQDAAAPLALRIMVLADRVRGNGFAPPPGFLASSLPAKAKLESDDLVMLSPVDRQKIVNDPGLPKDQQRLALRARLKSGDGQLWWFVDGNCVGSCQSSEVLWWDPVAGEHSIRVVDASGLAAVARVEVIGSR